MYTITNNGIHKFGEH